MIPHLTFFWQHVMKRMSELENLGDIFSLGKRTHSNYLQSRKDRNENCYFPSAPKNMYYQSYYKSL